MKGTWQTTDGGGSGLAVPLAIGAAVLAAAVAGPVAAAVGELLRAVVIIAAVAAALAVAAVAAAVALRLRGGYSRPRVLPPRVYGSTSVHAVQGRPEPRALPPRQEVHVHHHWHGVSAEDVAAIIRQEGE
jgi:hypothetical protein